MPIQYSQNRQLPLSSTTTSFSPPALINSIPGVCESPDPFPTATPISRPHKMALMAEVKRVAAEFEFSDEDVNKSVKEFIAEMSAYIL